MHGDKSDSQILHAGGVRAMHPGSSNTRWISTKGRTGSFILKLDYKIIRLIHLPASLRCGLADLRPGAVLPSASRDGCAEKCRLSGETFSVKPSHNFRDSRRHAQYARRHRRLHEWRPCEAFGFPLRGCRGFCRHAAGNARNRGPGRGDSFRMPHRHARTLRQRMGRPDQALRLSPRALAALLRPRHSLRRALE